MSSKLSSNQIAAVYHRYLNSNDYSLNDCYESYSCKKARAWRYCEDLLKKHNGHGLKIIGHNSMMFSAGFLFEDPTGTEVFAYITRDYDRLYEVTNTGFLVYTDI